MSIASRLKEARLLRGYTQDSLADAIGVSRGVISNIEYEKTEPSSPVAHSICEVLQIDERWLITGEGTMGANTESEKSFKILSDIYRSAKELPAVEQDYILDMIKTFRKHREQIIDKKDM